MGLSGTQSAGTEPIEAAAVQINYATRGAHLLGKCGKHRNVNWYRNASILALCAASCSAVTIILVAFGYIGRKYYGLWGVFGEPNGAPAAVYWLTALSSCLIAFSLAICWLVWIYKIHVELEEYTGGRYPISPGKAVGFCLLPVFNLYWIAYMPFRFAQELEALVGANAVRSRRILLLQILAIAPGSFFYGLGSLFSAIAMIRIQSGLNELWAESQSPTVEHATRNSALAHLPAARFRSIITLEQRL